MEAFGMKSNIRPWIVAVSLTCTLLLLFSFQNCAPMLPLEGVASVNSSARATATPGPLATPNPGTGGYTQNVIDGVCSDDVTADPMAARYITSGNGSLVGFTNTATKQTALWKVSGGNVIHGIVCSITGSQSYDKTWSLAGIGDFNGDGNPDVLWRNSENSQVAVWLMNGANRTSTAILTVSGSTTPMTMTADWKVEGIGLFDGTGRQGIVWRSSTGSIVVWSMNGLNSPTATVLGNVSTSYSIAGLGDFDGNYRSDILFRNGGSHFVWFTDRDALTKQERVFADALPAGVSTKVIGDFNGDAKSDLLLVNANGSMTVRYISYLGQITSPLEISAPASGWILQFAQDVTTDGVADWIWIIPGSTDKYLAYTPMSGAPGTTRTLNTIKTGWELFNYSHY